MKKFLIVLLIFTCLLFVGCTSEENAAENGTDRFVVLDEQNGIVYDEITEICYYIINGAYGNTYTPFYDSDKQLLTKDEYREIYQ